MKTGLVLKSTGSWYEVLVDSTVQQARTRGKLRMKGLKTTNPVAVGDRVALSPDHNDQWLIEDILPRDNYIIRQSVHKRGHAHILAANVDQVVVIATLAKPRTSLGFIDRMLVTAEAFRIPQVLVFNKKDLLGEAQQQEIERLFEVYSSIDVHCLQTSAESKEGINTFFDCLHGKKTLLSGHSGVGKSSLLNHISPDIAQKTAEISSYVDKGVHTTTFAEMFQVDPSTFIIDTPGIKELGLIDIPPEELADYFPEMREIQHGCKFNNCLHEKEPKCAVKAAVEAGEIADFRYRNYLNMLHSED